MDIYVFDKHFTLLGVLDNYSSLIWIRDYYGIGTVELHALIDQNSLSLLKKGVILVKEDDLTEAMIIDSIRMDDNNVETMVAKGFSIESLLDDRIVMGTKTYSDTVEVVMRSFVNVNAIVDTKRKIPYLTLGNLSGITTKAMEVNSYGYLGNLMKEIATKYDVGWRIVFDRTNKRYVFEVYVGEDHSIEQSVNPRLIFSSDYENIFEQTYTDSDTTKKTTAIVAGEGEDPNRVIVKVNDELTGFDRKELFVDARDLTSKDENNQTIPSSTYNSMLKERGLSKLTENDTIRTFESGITTLSNLKYRKDFDLGYKVTIQNEKWGLLLNTRITSIEEVYENNTKDIRVNFGSVIPTILDKINKAVK